MDGIEELQRASAGRTSQSNDVCHYSLYFPPPRAGTSKAPTSIESAQATAAAILEYAQELCDSVQPEGGYIWQRESFKLRPSKEALPTSAAGAVCLEGSTTVGESVEDEWWIVWLLREISKKWSEAVVEIHDNDGQFLLIEAAEHLPSWLNPDNADNRLWISAGDLHLIPLSANETEGHLSLATALGIMFDSTKKASMLASAAISQAIWSRTTSTYNSVKTEHSHRTIAYLPDEIIRILHSDPSLITKAVTTFYERDAVQLKACQYMRRFRPSPAHYATVRMTRSLYAQLASQRFYPPKPFERAGWLDVSADEDPTSTQSIESRRRDIGMKIACGFEMLYQEEKSSTARRRETSGTKIHIDRDGARDKDDSDLRAMPTPSSHPSQNQAYLKYMVALTESGYFQGETAGSSLYNQLEARAKTYWEEMQDDRAAKGYNLAEKIDELAESTARMTLPASESLKEDADSWLYIDESRLEEMLQGKPDRVASGNEAASENPSSISVEEREEKMAQEQAQRLQGMAEKFSSFLEGEGDLEGAMFEDETFSEDDEDSEAEGDEGGEMVAGPSMAPEDRQKRLEKLVPALSDAEWGSAAANQARLSAKRTEDAKKAEEDAKSSLHTGTNSMSAGPSKSDMQSAGLAPSEKYDGDDSGDELFEEEEVAEEHEANPKPRLLSTTTMEELSDEDDAQIEFGDGERDDFLKFAREALGLTEEQYGDILRSREKRGAFVPRKEESDDLHHKKPSIRSSGEASGRPSKPDSPLPAHKATAVKQQPNSRLDSFEALMAAMDTELSKARQGAQVNPVAPGQNETTSAQMDVDDEGIASDEEEFDFADLDAELAAALKRDESDSAPGDYTMIKNFLESFKSQNGLAGPVSNVFGRLDKDFSMPRDQ